MLGTGYDGTSTHTYPDLYEEKKKRLESDRKGNGSGLGGGDEQGNESKGPVECGRVDGIGE